MFRVSHADPRYVFAKCVSHAAEPVGLQIVASPHASRLLYPFNWCGTSESTGAIKMRLAASSTVSSFTECRIPKHLSQVSYRVAVDKWYDVEIAQECLNDTGVVHQTQADAEELQRAHLDLHLAAPQKQRDVPTKQRRAAGKFHSVPGDLQGPILGKVLTLLMSPAPTEQARLHDAKLRRNTSWCGERARKFSEACRRGSVSC